MFQTRTNIDHNINPFSNYLCLYCVGIVIFKSYIKYYRVISCFQRLIQLLRKNGRKLTTISALFANKNNVVWFNSSYVWFKVAVYLTISSQKVFKFYYILFLQLTTIFTPLCDKYQIVDHNYPCFKRLSICLQTFKKIQ